MPSPEGVEVRFAGTLEEESDVAEILSAADLFLLPSLQDNLPNIAIEAQACGCPVVGFATGGVVETIEPGFTGTLSTELSAAGLASAAADFISRMPDHAENARRCRSHFETRFTYRHHAQSLTALYKEILAV